MSVIINDISTETRQVPKSIQQEGTLKHLKTRSTMSLGAVMSDKPTVQTRCQNLPIVDELAMPVIHTIFHDYLPRRGSDVGGPFSEWI